MSTYHGEPYPGFFKQMEEDAAKVEHGLPADSIIAWDENAGLNVSAQWVEAVDPQITKLQEEVAELCDQLKRTEDFVNSMLRNRTVSGDMDITVIKPKKVVAREDYDRAMKVIE